MCVPMYNIYILGKCSLIYKNFLVNFVTTKFSFFFFIKGETFPKIVDVYVYIKPCNQPSLFGIIMIFQQFFLFPIILLVNHL